MTNISIIHVDSDEHIQQLRDLLDEYLAPLRDIAAQNAIEVDAIPTFNGLDDELATLPGIFAPSRGRFFVALDDDRVIGCVALKPVDETTGELKRMYVAPGYRGQGIGWRLVESLVAAAREIGYQRIILDSHISMTKAHSIYRGVGFKDVPTPEDFPAFLKGNIVFMVLDLRSATD